MREEPARLAGVERDRRRRQRLERRLARPPRGARPRGRAIVPDRCQPRLRAGGEPRCTATVDGVPPRLQSGPAPATPTPAAKLVAARLQAAPTSPSAGPRILEPSGAVYPSARAFPSIGDAAGHALFGMFMPQNPFSRRYRLAGFLIARTAVATSTGSRGPASRSAAWRSRASAASTRATSCTSRTSTSAGGCDAPDGACRLPRRRRGRPHRRRLGPRATHIGC